MARTDSGRTSDLLQHDKQKPETPTGFETKCRAVADGMERIGTRLRIALTGNSQAVPFVIHARYEINTRMHVYGQTETETAIRDALKPIDATCQEFLDEAARTGRRLAKPQTPLPVVWDEPALVIAGMAPGTVAHWRRRRAECENPAGTER